MNIDPNDPRLTAFVLGELDPSERAIVEGLLIDSADSRHAVEEIRLTAQWLSEQLHEESRAHAPAPTPAATAATPDLNHRVVPHSILTPTPPPRPWWRKMPSHFHLVAAGVLLAAGLTLISLIRVSKMAPPERGVVAVSALPAPKAASENVDRRVMLRSVKAAAPKNLRGWAGSPAPSPASALPTVQTVSGAGRALKPGSSADYYYESPAESKPPGPDSAGQKLAAAAPAAPAPPGVQSAPAGSSGERRSLGLASPGPDSRDSLAEQSLGKARGEGEALLAGRMRASKSVLGGMGGRMPAAGGEPQAPASRPFARAEGVLGGKETELSRAKSKQEARADAERSKQPPAVEFKLSDKAKENAPATPEDKPQDGLASQEMKELAQAPERPIVAALEVYAPIVDNPFQLVSKDRQSTFSIDVDTASYSNIRRFLNHDMLPPPDAVRIEEMLNYFPYHDAPPPDSSDLPFAVHVEVAGCPWNAGHRLARIGIAAKPIDQSKRSASNLVFLVDVSGSMDNPNKLPLVQWGLQRMVEQLNENDRIAIVIYADAAGVFLPSTSCMKKAEISSAIEGLKAAGSTNGGAGIQLAYDLATANFIKNGINRVILATDGDFNIGISDDDDLVKLITAKAKSGVFLSVLGFGMGNIKDAKLEKLANKGSNGHFAYIDSPREAYKVLVEEMGATLINVAKDVKIQVDFIPERIAEFRLIGYENRALAHEDFENDKKDAGDIGAGHHVTALYELTPAQEAAQLALAQRTDMKRDSNSRAVSPSFNVKLRYKKPNQDQSMPTIEHPVVDSGLDFGRASGDLKFAAAVAGFGMMLRDSRYKGTLTYEGVLEIAGPTLADDPSGYRREFAGLVRKARDLNNARVAPVPLAAPAK